MHFKEFTKQIPKFGKQIITSGTFRWIIVPFVTILIATLYLLWEIRTGSYQNSHEFLIILVCLATIFYRQLTQMMKYFVNITGLEKERSTLKIQVSLFGSFFLSFYLLLGGTIISSPALQFSIIPVTATLGGLVISGANYSQLNTEQRNELLRVAQKLIVSTISFIFFVAIFSLTQAGRPLIINNLPYVLPSSSIYISRLILFWFSVMMFYLGTILFILGIIDLALILKKLKLKESIDLHLKMSTII